MKPYYEQDGITIWHGDCREKRIEADAVVSDPPYGMNWNTNSKRFSGGQRDTQRAKQQDPGRDWPAVIGDDQQFDPRTWLTYKNVILWGANHYNWLLPAGSWLVWIKKHAELFGTFLSDCELAWHSQGRGVYAFEKSFPPPSRMAETGTRQCVHPTQKPTELMQWCIERTAGIVLDPFMGSGTTLVAAKNLGRTAIGIEIEERYCEVAAKRLSQQVMDFST